MIQRDLTKKQRIKLWDKLKYPEENLKKPNRKIELTQLELNYILSLMIEDNIKKQNG